MTESSNFTALEKFMKGIDAEALSELVEMTGMNRTSFVQADPVSTSYNEGIRNVGLRLLHMLDKQPAEALRDSYKRRLDAATKNRFRR